ncbi:MAG: hypothetical protein E7434_01440 [Ruminococcaceae bacterium]|nr:hypothetical protein [Oscillospiraceae bacterium]
MKLSNFMRRSLAMLVLLATLLALVPNVFATEDDNGIPKELQGKDLIAELDENGDLVYTEADEATKAAMRASSFNVQATQDFSKKARVAFFIDPSKSENSSHLAFTISNTNIDNLTARGVTDFFVMTKTKAGTFSVTNLKNVISHAGSAANVYAWMHCARDDAYLASTKAAAQYHYRVGQNNIQNGGDTGITGFVDLAYSAYITKMQGHIDSVEACSGVDGVLLDSVSFGSAYMGWGSAAQSYMGKTVWNAVIPHLVRTANTDGGANWYYKANTSGYYVYNASSGTQPGSSVSKLADYLNSNDSNAAKCRAYRNSVITNFISKMRSSLASNLYLGVAIESSWENTYAQKGITGQDPSNFKSQVTKGFCVAKTFFDTIGVYTNYDYPLTTAKAVAKLGCNVFIGIDGYWTNNSLDYIWYDPLYYQSYNIYNARFAVNGDLSYGGDILGAAVYTAGNMGMMKITVSAISSTPDVTVDFVNPNIKTYGMLSYFHKYNDTDASYNFTKAGITSGSRTQYGGSMEYFASTTSSIGYIGTWTSYTNSTIAAFGTGNFKAPVKNLNVTYDTLPFARFGLYDSTIASADDYEYTDIIPMYPHWVIGNHTSCSFTETVKVTADCTNDGYSIMKCGTCGYDYIKVTSNGGHSYGDAVVTNPTCTVAGSKAYTCSLCGDVKTETIAATGHTAVTDAAVAATCTATGLTEGSHCSVCNTVLTAQETVAMLPHTEVETPYVAPTCSSSGATGGTVCSVCNTVIVADVVIPPLDHTPVTDEAIAPSCDESGLTEGSHCGVCNAVIVAQQVVDALGHDYEAVVTPPTCETDGYTTYTCTQCSDSYIDDEIASFGHDYIAVVTEPTCQTGGYTTYTCCECTHSYTSDYTDAYDHDYVATVTDPTCTEDGYTTYSCTMCDESFQADVVSAYGHDYMATVVAPTCTEQGYTRYTCECGDTYDADYVPTLEHDYVYDEDGEGHSITCSACDYSNWEDHDVVDGTCTLCGAQICDHSETAVTVDVEATCTEDGSQHTYCTLCDMTLSTETIPATGHDVSFITAKSATCTEEGNRDYWLCANCGSYFADEACEYALPSSFVFIAPTGHNYASTVIDPTCDTVGCTSYTCSVCGDNYTTDEIPALGHDYAAVITDPTCTEVGYTTYTCTVCSDTYTDDEVAALGHDYDAVVTAPTCTEVGYTTYTCSVCSDTYTGDEVAALGHDYASVVTAPTCTENGYTTYTCTVCSDTYTDDTVEATGHSYCYDDNGENHIVTCENCDYNQTEDHVPEGFYCVHCNAFLCDHPKPITVIDKEATCTEEGAMHKHCIDCEQDYDYEVVPATGHCIEFVAAKSATCTEDGNVDYWHCEYCDTYFADEDCKYDIPYSFVRIAASGHNYTSSVINPTCDTAGYTSYICSNCDDSYTDNEVPALGHDYTAEVTAPTCDADGYTTYTCSVCGDSYTDDEVTALGHDYTSEVTAPTCDADGYTTYTCSVCGDSYTADEVAALGHTYVYTDNESNHTVTCENCDYNAEENHTYDENNTCICGFTPPVNPFAPEYNENLNFTMSISAGAEMTVTYSIMGITVNSYTDFYLEVKKDVAGGDPVTTVYGITEDREQMTAKVNPSTGEALMYQVTYKGINAKEMGDNFSTTLYAVDAEGTVYCGDTSVKSIKSYLLEKADAEASIPELKTMAIDMLKYGAAAQVRLGYNTENLVTADLTEEQLSYATQTTPEAVNYAATSGTGASVNTNITVTSRVQLNLSCIYTTATDPNAVKCVITDSEGNVLAEIAATNKSGIMFSAIYEDVGAKQMRDVINATFYEGETAISQTVSWSVESYVAQVLAKDNATEDEINMVNAMLTYGDAVAAYMEAK